MIWRAARRCVPACLAACLVLLAAPHAAPQPPGRVSRVAYLTFSAMAPELARLLEILRAALRDHGWVEGQNLAFEVHSAEGNADRLSVLAGDLAGRADVLVVAAPSAIRAAQAATRTTPIVFIGAGDPVAGGFVASLARPGGNLTGLTGDAGPELGAKWLELAKEVLPGLSRIAVLWDSDPPGPITFAYRAAMESAARQLRLAFHWTNVPQRGDLAGALAAIESARPGVLVWCFSNLRDQPVLDFAARHRLPAVGCWREPVTRGALMSYAPSFADLFRRTAAYVDKLLKGARPADLPVERPTKLELVVNLRTARALGLTMPPAILARADEVIE